MSKQLYSAFYQHDTGMIPLSSIYFIGDWLLWQFQRITVVMSNSNCINSNSLFIVKDRFNISQLVTVIANTHCILKQRGESEQATPKYIYSDLKILLLSRNWLPHQVPMVFKSFKMIYGDHGNMRIVKPYFIPKYFLVSLPSEIAAMFLPFYLLIYIYTAFSAIWKW